MTRFDRTAPGEGMMIYSRIENGKAYLEFQFFLKTDETDVDCVADIRVYDMSGKLVLEIEYPMREEEPAKGMLLHPHLWRGMEDPSLYSVKVQLQLRKQSENKICEVTLDTLEKQLPLRMLKNQFAKGYFLNGEAYAVRPIVYHLPSQSSPDISRLEQIQRELQLYKEMGANTICLQVPEYDDDFVQLCDKMGFLVWCGDVKEQIAQSCDLLTLEASVPTDLYFYKKACWSKKPFLYIVNKSLERQKNGNYSLTVYSNQKKVALYVEGVLFEFQVSTPEFLFEEIPAGKRPLQLTAEAGECRVSMTVYH